MKSIALLTAFLTSMAFGQLREVWSRHPIDFQNSLFLTTWDGAIDNDGSFYMAGSMAEDSQMITYKVSSNGYPIWHDLRSVGNGSQLLNRVSILTDGTVVVAGRYAQGSLNYCIAVRYTANGQALGNYTDQASSANVFMGMLDGDRPVLMTRLHNPQSLLTAYLDPSVSLIQRHVFTSTDERFRPVARGIVVPPRIYRTPSVDVNSRVEARILSLDENANVLYYLPLCIGSVHSEPTESGLSAISSESPVAGCALSHGFGWETHVSRLDPTGQALWSQVFAAGTLQLARTAPIWVDPDGSLLASRRDPGIGQILYQFDPEDGRVLQRIAMPAPTGFNNYGYSRFFLGERGERYCVGFAYNERDGLWSDVRLLFAKLDRNFRTVWMQVLNYSEALPSWMAYQKGHLFVMTNAIPRPPFVKLQILAVRSEGDVSGDGCIDDKDLAMVLEAFGTANPSADLNGDGIVDDLDLEEVLHNFGLGCE